MHDAPLSSFEAPAQIRSACDGMASIGYILARGYDGPFGQFYAKAGERRWWREELACGRDVMLDMPNELTALCCCSGRRELSPPSFAQAPAVSAGLAYGHRPHLYFNGNQTVRL